MQYKNRTGYRLRPADFKVLDTYGVHGSYVRMRCIPTCRFNMACSTSYRWSTLQYLQPERTTHPTMLGGTENYLYTCQHFKLHAYLGRTQTRQKRSTGRHTTST